MRSKGRIAHWDEQKGFGFIAPDSGGERVFVHISAFVNRGYRPAVDDQVRYSVSKDREGRTRAARVLLGGESDPAFVRRWKGALWITFAALFLVSIAWLVKKELLPDFVLHIYLGASAVAFLVYAWDKNAARADRRRTPESTLHWIAILGGWPGAVVAQQLLRHKSSKFTFRFVFLATIAINIALFGWTLNELGLIDVDEVLGYL